MKTGSYRQFLTVAVISATMGGFAVAETPQVQTGYVPAMGSTSDRAPVMTANAVTNTSAVNTQAPNIVPVVAALPAAVPATDYNAMEQINQSPEQGVGEALANASWPDAQSIAVDPMRSKVAKSIEVIAGKDTLEKGNQPVIVGEVPAQYVSGVTTEKLAPFLNRTITDISVSPVPAEYKDRVQALITTKIGDVVTTENVEANIAALGNLGVFSEVNPQFLVVPEGVKINYQLVPNPRLTGVAVEGNTVYTTDQLLKYIDAPSGKILNTVEVGKKLQGINAAYRRDGYILSHVTGVQVSPTGILSVGITEGSVEAFKVEGNKKTKTRVITRELIQKTDKPFNTYLMRRSMQRVYNTGYFEDVNTRLLEGSTPDKVVVQIDVLEQRTGTVTVGAGYSGSDGMVGIIELGENNFRGTGDKVNIHWEFGGNTKNKNYTLSYTRPWIDDKGTSLGFSIFNRQDEYTDYQSDGSEYSKYDRRSRGYGLSFGRQTDEFTRDYLNINTRKDEWVDHVSGYDYNDGSDYLSKNFGRTNSMTYQRVIDTRDNVYDPTKGKRLSYSAQWAGHGLGGDFNFYKLMVEARTYKKVGSAHVWAFRVGAGIATGSVPYSQLFSVGGSETLRGYEDDQFRGKKYYNATVEYRFPLMNKVQGVLFADVGSAWDAPDVPWHTDGNKFNVGIGPGLRIITPIGPVRLDYGFGKDGGKFSFAFGGQF